MKPIYTRLLRHLRLPLLLTAACLLAGCTSVVWDKGAFNSYCRPANPTGLKLYYSSQREDVLVRYNEFNEHNSKTEPRSYWLMSNAERIGAGRKPHFLSETERANLIIIPITEKPDGIPSAGRGAVARQDDDVFTLYSSGEKLDPYSLPIYRDPHRRAKQIALTPLAVTVDATVIGGVIVFCNAPEILAGMSR